MSALTKSMKRKGRSRWIVQTGRAGFLPYLPEDQQKSVLLRAEESVCSWNPQIDRVESTSTPPPCRQKEFCRTTC